MSPRGLMPRITFVRSLSVGNSNAEMRSPSKDTACPRMPRNRPRKASRSPGRTRTENPAASRAWTKVEESVTAGGFGSDSGRDSVAEGRVVPPCPVQDKVSRVRMRIALDRAIRIPTSCLTRSSRDRGCSQWSVCAPTPGFLEPDYIYPGLGCPAGVCSPGRQGACSFENSPTPVPPIEMLHGRAFRHGDSCLWVLVDNEAPLVRSTRHPRDLADAQTDGGEFASSRGLASVLGPQF